MNNNPLDENRPLNSESLESTTDYTSDEPATRPPTNQRKSEHRQYALVVIVIIVGLIVLAGGAALFLRKPAKIVPPAVTPITINTQSLDNGTLNKLISQAAPNETRQQLTIAPDTLFKSSVEVQKTLTADKDLNVGGNQNIKGTTTLQSAVGINSNLAVRGALSVGGSLSAGSLNVGALVVSTVNASGSLNFGGHLIPSGAAPNAVISAGAGGGSVTIDGNDTAGTVVINVGSTNLVAGEMAAITFRTAFAGTPKVQLTPVNAAASKISYFATRSPTFFTIESSTVPTADTQYAFDYLITQ